MKNIVIIILLFSTLVSRSQETTVRGTVSDAATGEPVPFASVAVKNTATGTITNEEGSFAINCPKTGQLLISSIGYKTLEISPLAIDERNKKVLLEPENILLEEVVVSNIPVYEVLEGVIASSLAKFDRQLVVKTYYREFVKDNGKITKFSDGLLDYHIERDAKKVRSDIIVRQNRSVQLFSVEDEEFFKDLDSDLNVQEGIKRGDFIVIRDVIKNHDKYHWHLKSTGIDEDELTVITFEPKEGIEKALLEGSVTYDAQTGLIFEATAAVAQSHMQYGFGMNLLGLKYKMLDRSYVARYKVVDGVYILSNISRYQKFKFWTKKKVDETIEFKSDLVVTDFVIGKPLKDGSQFYKKKQLYKKPTNYTDKFWRGNNAIVLTEAEQATIQSLEEVKADPTLH